MKRPHLMVYGACLVILTVGAFFCANVVVRSIASVLLSALCFRIMLLPVPDPRLDEKDDQG